MIHHVFANRSNIGDWLSARAIQSLLKPYEVIEHLCDAPFVAETLRRLATATDKDLIVIGGGGLFMDYFEPFWEGFGPIAERVPFVIWGAGYCDMKRGSSHPPRPLLERIVAKARLCVVRDELTRSYLECCELPPAVPCPSMTVVAVPPSPGCGLLYADAYDNIGAEVYERAVSTLKGYAARTGRHYRQTDNTIPKGNASQLARTLGLYVGADLVVASRLHGCILGVAMGRKVLAISGDRKIESFMRAAGLGEWVLDLEEIGDLGERLAELPGQASVTEFVTEACRKNGVVAEQVKALVRPRGTRGGSVQGLAR